MSNETKEPLKGKLLSFFCGIRAGSVLTLVALVFTAAGYAVYFHTMAAFGYPIDRFVIVFSVFSLLFLSFLFLNGVIVGDRTGTFVLYALVAVFLTLALCRYLSPCLSNIGIYFTVGNMGDVEANAVGVPSCIRGVAFYLVATLSTVASGFFRTVKKGASVFDVFAREEEV